MDVGFIADRLEQHGAVILQILDSCDDVETRWRPDGGGWTILEIAAHLLDEEREDFRQRIDYVLHRPGEAWPGIDPEGWVSERKYSERDPAQVRAELGLERKESVRWLRTLTEADWQVSYSHPLGPLSAGDLLSSWCAHDMLHIRQLLSRRFQYAAQQTQPFSPAYAGNW